MVLTLKNMIVKMGSSSPIFGVKISKISELPPPRLVKIPLFPGGESPFPGAKCLFSGGPKLAPDPIPIQDAIRKIIGCIHFQGLGSNWSEAKAFCGRNGLGRFLEEYLDMFHGISYITRFGWPDFWTINSLTKWWFTLCNCLDVFLNDLRFNFLCWE